MTDADDRRETELRRGCHAGPNGAASAEDNILFLLRRLDEARAARERRVVDLLAANNALLERARAAEAATVAHDKLWRDWWEARRGRRSYDEPPDGPGKIGDMQWRIVNDYSHPPMPLPEPPHD